MTYSSLHPARPGNNVWHIFQPNETKSDAIGKNGLNTQEKRREISRESMGTLAMKFSQDRTPRVWWDYERFWVNWPQFVLPSWCLHSVFLCEEHRKPFRNGLQSSIRSVRIRNWDTTFRKGWIQHKEQDIIWDTANSQVRTLCNSLHKGRTKGERNRKPWLRNDPDDNW